MNTDHLHRQIQLARMEASFAEQGEREARAHLRELLRAVNAYRTAIVDERDMAEAELFATAERIENDA